jgi:RNA polymerase sigma factor (sigma-70 family)
MSKWFKTENGNLDTLIRKCVEGERNAQNELYRMFSSKMMNVCLRYSRSREEAEDTLVESFMKVFENIHKFRNQGSLEGWIRKIMVNTAIEKYRKKNVLYPSIRIDDVTEVDFSSGDAISDMSAKELIRMVQELPAGYQMVFNLYAFEGLKHKEIAERLGITEGTSKSNLFDARAILRKEVAKSLKQAKAANE